MVRTYTPAHSDDDFDIIPAADAVSGISDGPGVDYHQSSSSNYSGTERLTRPHEVPQVPQVPHVPDHDTAITSVVEKPSEHTNDNLYRDPKASEEIGNFINNALKNTKSVYDKLVNKDAIIAVMGMTGSGKTTFISKATGRTDLKIGHDLASCTQDVQLFKTQINRRTVHFVDTPGFSDTNLSDTDILEIITSYLSLAYKQETKLSGIVYVHPISDRRVTQHNIKNLDMLRKLTGDKNIQNVILVTSMWDKVTEEEGAKREKELEGKYWKLLLAAGARTVRHNGTPESARHISSMLLDNTPFYLQLQEEMGKGNKALRDTAAGRAVMLEIVRVREEHQRELADMESMMKNAAQENQGVIEALKDHYQGILGKLKKTLHDERRMNEEALGSLTHRVHELEDRGGGCIIL